MKQGSWSIRRTPHIKAMRVKKATLNKRLKGVAVRLCPTRTFRTIGTRIRMNATGKSHKRPNNTRRPGAFCPVIVLFRDSRMTNGSTRMKLMINGDFRLARRKFDIRESPFRRMML
jgi:hypothetical protein